MTEIKTMDAGKSIFMTKDEATDPKNASKRAHRSISPKYDSTGLIGYTIGNYTPGYLKHLAEMKKKKKEDN